MLRCLYSLLNLLMLLKLAGGRESQCSLVVDTLTEGRHDYLYKYGSAISLEPAGKYILECVPEYGISYGDVVCHWWKNGLEYKPGFGSVGDFWAHKGCTLHTYLSPMGSEFTPGGNMYNNYTCYSYDRETEKDTIMNYILYFLSPDSILIGFHPHASKKLIAKQFRVGATVDIPCQATITQASSVFRVNWYLLDSIRNRTIDVRDLERHSTSLCGRSSKDPKMIMLMLTINDVTADMWENQYECRVTKVDVVSPYNQSLAKYNLHSADPLEKEAIGLVPKPDSSDLSKLAYYENGTKGVCTLDKPCMATVRFHLQKPTLITTYKIIFVAVVISVTLAVVLALLIGCWYHKRVFIHNYIKHGWAITEDTVADYRYQAAIFYADRSTEAEDQFIQSQLLVKLENKWKYKTFVPQRDYLIGSTQADECIKGLKNSQRVIFILTETLFAEEWKIYALDVALNKHRKIILIKFEDINFQELLDKHGKKFSEVESALKVSTVIDWQQKHRWKRLHLELPTIINESRKHQITLRLQKCFRSAKM